MRKMNPPLRTSDDVEAIKEGLKDGTIDCIVTDHAPHHIDEKNCEFALALNGIVGFETSLGLGLQYLVKSGVLTLNELIEKMAVNPSRILRINKGSLSIDADADITIFLIRQKNGRLLFQNSSQRAKTLRLTALLFAVNRNTL